MPSSEKWNSGLRVPLGLVSAALFSYTAGEWHQRKIQLLLASNQVWSSELTAVYGRACDTDIRRYYARADSFLFLTRFWSVKEDRERKALCVIGYHDKLLSFCTGTTSRCIHWQDQMWARNTSLGSPLIEMKHTRAQYNFTLRFFEKNVYLFVVYEICAMF